jgi:hypothetical protein
MAALINRNTILAAIKPGAASQTNLKNAGRFFNAPSRSFMLIFCGTFTAGFVLIKINEDKGSGIMRKLP